LELFDINLNDVMRDWKVLDVTYEKHSQYFGIIYINKEEKQLVLAHKSTDFILGGKIKNLF
jgi:hypothetical protein